LLTTALPTAFAAQLSKLQSAVEKCPLAVLTYQVLSSTERITDNQSAEFVNGVSTAVSSWEQQLPHNPNLVHLLDLQGTALIATEQQLQLRFHDKLYSETRPDKQPFPNPSYLYLKDVTTTVRQLTESRQLWASGTPNLALYKRADVLAHSLESDVVSTLSTSTGPKLTPAEAAALGLAEASAFQADYDASLTARPGIDRIADAAVSTLKYNLSLIAQLGVDQAEHAQEQFVQQMFDDTGLFGPQGPLSEVFTAPVNPFDNPQHTGGLDTSGGLLYAGPHTNGGYYTMYTFANAKVEAEPLTQSTTYFRVFSDPVLTGALPPNVNENNYEGTFVSTQEFFNPNTAIRKLALDQSWYHPSLATMKVNVTVKATPQEPIMVYVGTAAPILQGVYAPESKPSLYPGGAQQVVLPAAVAFNLDNYSNSRPIWSQPVPQSPHKLNRRPTRLQLSPPTITPIPLDFNKQLTDKIKDLMNQPITGQYLPLRKALLLDYALANYKTLLNRDTSFMKAYRLSSNDYYSTRGSGGSSIEPDYFSKTMLPVLHTSSDADYDYTQKHYDYNSADHQFWVDFANRKLGGGVFTDGFLQEETLFLETPELASAATNSLLTRTGGVAVLRGTPSPLIFMGAHRVMNIESGWMVQPNVPRDQENWRAKSMGEVLSHDEPLLMTQKINVLSMAAPNLQKDKPTPEDQSKPEVLQDLFNTFYAGFMMAHNADQNSSILINTGPIGAGNFHNNKAVVNLMQQLAAIVVSQQTGAHVNLKFWYYDENKPRNDAVYQTVNNIINDFNGKGTKTISVLLNVAQSWAFDLARNYPTPSK